MLFSSITFLYYFLPITLLVYFVMPQKGKNAVLLTASLLFYFWGEPKYCFLMAGIILVGYFSGRILEKQKNPMYRKIAGTVSIVVMLCLLFVFKYLDFAITSVNQLFHSELALVKLALPIGISFYMFQIISYIVDVYRREVKAEHNFLDFAMYVSLFPQLIAGPIVRYETVAAEIKNRTSDFDKIAYGIGRFVMGLAKKVLIADSFGLLVEQLDLLEGKGMLGYWMIAIAYTMQIYFDFSGYSDMAIGLGRIFGFQFPENFNYPYISKSITEFWRRWHMTLGGWFRDYVYIPLGGNRVSKWKWLRNVLVVWALSGLWHGAGINFVIWGIYYGLLLIFEKVFLGKYLKKCPGILQNIYTMLLVIAGFAIFRTENLSEVMGQLLGMIGISGTEVLEITSQTCIYYLRSYFWIFILAVIGATPFPKYLLNRLEQMKTGRMVILYLKPVCYLLLLVIVTGYLVNGSFNAFLYFRF